MTQDSPQQRQRPAMPSGSTLPPASVPAQHDAGAPYPADTTEVGAERPLPARTAAAQQGRHWWPGLRGITVGLLLVVATVCALLTPPVVWSRNVLLDTDRYVQTLAPLASDPGIQAGVVKAVDEQIDAHLDVQALLTEALPPRAQVLAGPISSAAQGFVNTVVTRFVQSPAFATLWVQINRAAHEQVAAVLTDKHSGAVQITNDQVVLDLTPVVAEAKARLVSAGLTVADQIPTVGATIKIADVKGVDRARGLVRILDRAANWLPWVTLALFALAVAAARQRRRRLIAAAACIAGAMVVLRVALAGGRAVFLGNLPGVYFSRDASGFLFDTVTRYLIDGIRLVFLLALVVIAIAVLAGPSRSAVALRAAVRSAPQRESAAAPAGVPGISGSWVRPAIWTVVALAGVVLVINGSPSLAFVVTTLVVAGVLMVLGGMLHRPTAPQHGASRTGDG